MRKRTPYYVLRSGRSGYAIADGDTTRGFVIKGGQYHAIRFRCPGAAEVLGLPWGLRAVRLVRVECDSCGARILPRDPLYDGGAGRELCACCGQSEDAIHRRFRT